MVIVDARSLIMEAANARQWNATAELVQGTIKTVHSVALTGVSFVSLRIGVGVHSCGQMTASTAMPANEANSVWILPVFQKRCLTESASCSTQPSLIRGFIAMVLECAVARFTAKQILAQACPRKPITSAICDGCYCS